jgi:hypothetical protein
MKATSDFKLWLEENAPETEDDLYCLYRAVTDRTNMGKYAVFEMRGRTFVKCGDATPLLIANVAAKQLFLINVGKLRSKIDPTSDPDMTMEGWYDCYKSQKKD